MLLFLPIALVFVAHKAVSRRGQPADPDDDDEAEHEDFYGKGKLRKGKGKKSSRFSFRPGYGKGTHTLAKEHNLMLRATSAT